MGTEELTKYQRPIRNLTDADALFFYDLSSCYHAMVSSAVDAVVVPNDLCPIHIPRNRAIFSHMYYDCHEDEEGALRVMKYRIENASEDIIKSFRMHTSFLDGINVFRREFKPGNRQISAKVIVKLIKDLTEYGNFINEHEKRLGDKMFLSYPSCVSGHMFHVAGYHSIRQNEFNKNQSYEGFMNGLDNLSDSLGLFRKNTAPIPGLNLQSIMDLDPNPISASLEGRIAITKQLLAQAGLELGNLILTK